MIQLVITIDADAEIKRGVSILFTANSKEPVTPSQEAVANTLCRLIQTAINMNPATVIKATSRESFDAQKKIFGDIVKSGEDEKDGGE